jgi:hypothetical protein
MCRLVLPSARLASAFAKPYTGIASFASNLKSELKEWFMKNLGNSDPLLIDLRAR